MPILELFSEHNLTTGMSVGFPEPQKVTHAKHFRYH